MNSDEHDSINMALALEDGWTCVGKPIPDKPPLGLAPYFKLAEFTTEQVFNHEVPIDDIPSYTSDKASVLQLIESRFTSRQQKQILLGCLRDLLGSAKGEDYQWQLLTAPADTLARAAYKAVQHFTEKGNA